MFLWNFPAVYFMQPDFFIIKNANPQKRICAFISCGGRTRTCDLQVMSLASYQLLHSAMSLNALKSIFLQMRVKRYYYFP